MKTTKTGYKKVSIDKMVGELLAPTHSKKLLLVHLQEIERIHTRHNRKKYVSKAQLEYITNLFIDVVLNNKSFKTVKSTPVKKDVFFHIGMLKLNQLQNGMV